MFKILCCYLKAAVSVVLQLAAMFTIFPHCIIYVYAHFLPRSAMHKCGLCCHAVSVCLSVGFSVCLVSQANKHILKLFTIV